MNGFTQSDEDELNDLIEIWDNVNGAEVKNLTITRRQEFPLNRILVLVKKRGIPAVIRTGAGSWVIGTWLG